MKKNFENYNKLIDPFGRDVNYLRVSVTDRCDFRCTYCMAEDMQFLPKKDILSLEEIEEICRQYDVPLKAAALQFPLLHPTHFSVIPGGQSTIEMSSNLDSMNFEIPGELWDSLKKANLMHPEAPTGR